MKYGRLSVLFTVVLLSGCSSIVAPLIYAGAKTKLSDTEVQYVAINQELIWHRNTSESQELDVNAVQWEELHRGSSGDWQWIFVASSPKDLSIKELAEWDELFVRFAEINDALLPSLDKVQVTLYLSSGSKQQVQVSSKFTSQVLELPYFYWGDKKNALPKQFSDRVDLLAEIGNELQLAQYVTGQLPQPTNNEASQLKKHANSACWRLAVRPALALGTAQIIKAPPSAFSDMEATASKVYQEHRNEIPAQAFYATVLLVNEADGYMAAADLNWPLRGSDAREINALLDFCKSYLMTAKDPRT